MTIQEKYITAADAARTLNVSRGAITYFVTQGWLQPVKIGSALLLERAELEALKIRRASNERTWINGIAWQGSGR
jgi:hypothetical protein